MLESSLKDKEWKDLKKLVRRAGAALMQYWPSSAVGQRDRSNTALETQIKGDGSPVTAADYASNEILVHGLQCLWPEDKIISEELSDDPLIRAAQRVWIIDPLDGTRSFVAGRDDFSILVALVVDQISVAGLMYFPVSDTMVCAVRGMGAEVNGQKITVSAANVLRKHATYYRNFEPLPGEHLFTESMDSGMAFLALARGDFDAVIIRMTSHREWDIAAPAVVLQEAGGVITDEQGKPLRFNRGAIDYQFVVAATARLHPLALQIASGV